MVDSDHLERIRVVYESEDGTTKVSEDVWPRDKDSLFPLQAALGYQLVQGIFFSRHQVIVEGLTDLWLLKALNQALAAKRRTTLKPDIVIVPAAGLTKLLPLASMLIGHDIDTIALLDGDEPARKEGKKLVDKLLVGEERKCIFIGDFVDNKNAEIEDIFPQDEYVSMVEAAYPNLKIHFTESETAITGVVNKIQAVFERNNLGHFEKWRVAEILRDRIVDAPDKVNDKTLDAIERIYSSLNSLFPKC
jgi:predicted ATP-dependent endonuclease of OLD family